jgi:hypothetical protein
MSDTKTCRRCGHEKVLDAFSRHGRTLDGRQSYCKPCATEYRRAWRRRAGGRPCVTY